MGQPPDDKGYRLGDKRPWFGPKRFGYGFRPQTWQGYLVVAVLVVATAVLGTLAKGHHLPAFVIAIPVVLILVAIGLFQRR